MKPQTPLSPIHVSPWLTAESAFTMLSVITRGTLVGVPDWAAVALLCYTAIACCNALAWLLTEVPDDKGEGGQ